MKNRIALVTGITGQDGSYLTELLLEKNYQVHGIKRRSSSYNTNRIDHIYQDPLHPETNLFLHYGDMTDSLNVLNLIKKINPDEIYNLAAMSHVKVSFEIPEYTSNVDALGTLRILESIRTLNLEKKVRFYQASTSELFGKVQEVPQNEKTPFYPRSPYGVAKLYSYWILKNYREAYNIFASNGILFNHESPRRGETFVTRKITMGIAKIVYGLQEKLYLGNLDSKRDWGHAKDYVRAMWQILQNDKPDDYVISSGDMHTVRDFVLKAFSIIGIKLTFEGSGENEKGIVEKNKSEFNLREGTEVVAIDKKYFRPTEVDLLVGDSTKAKKDLGWSQLISYEKMIEEMVISDIKLIEKKLNKYDY